MLGKLFGSITSSNSLTCHTHCSESANVHHPIRSESPVDNAVSAVVSMVCSSNLTQWIPLNECQCIEFHAMNWHSRRADSHQKLQYKVMRDNPLQAESNRRSARLSVYKVYKVCTHTNRPLCRGDHELSELSEFLCEISRICSDRRAQRSRSV